MIFTLRYQRYDGRLLLDKPREYSSFVKLMTAMVIRYRTIFRASRLLKRGHITRHMKSELGTLKMFRRLTSVLVCREFGQTREPHRPKCPVECKVKREKSRAYNCLIILHDKLPCLPLRTRASLQPAISLGQAHEFCTCWLSAVSGSHGSLLLKIQLACSIARTEYACTTCI